MSESRENSAESDRAVREPTMRKWFVTLAVLGVGGVGAFLLTDKGQETVRRWLAYLQDDSGRWDEWNESAQEELEHIQAALNQIAQSLEPHGELGR
jgi:DNA-binding PadR family transcriptional regulator